MRFLFDTTVVQGESGCIDQHKTALMELQAVLQHLHLYSPEPFRTAQFYSRAYSMAIEAVEGGFCCRGPGRLLRLSLGPANQLHYAHYAFQTSGAWQAFTGREVQPEHHRLPSGFRGPADSVCLKDPDGNLLVFSPPDSAGITAEVDLPPATLQHFAMRTPNLPAMLAFYADVGFVLSDAVKDGEGSLRACFLRTDVLHHSLALFLAPEARFDHQSFEAPDWASMREWGDHMAAVRVWGIGRHGPGNDVFFMVADPDGNLAEISSEIELCEAGRPAGLWPHEERTLNVWGKAIMRS
jgi:catechol 2,3-dioxygenase